MKKINGVKLDKFPFTDIKVISDLKYYDGPIITHFVSKMGNDYLSCWVDDEEATYRWLIFRVDKTALLNYLMNKTSLYTLLNSTNNEFIYLADILNDNYSQIFMLTKDNLDKEYMPTDEDIFGLNFPKTYNYLKEESNNLATI